MHDDLQLPVSDHSEEKVDVPKTENARYEVNVQHYAQYDKTETSGYSAETRKSLTYAARTPFARFFLDLGLILSRPSLFWRGQAEHPATLVQVHCPHLLVLIVLRTAAIILSGLFKSDQEISQVLVQAGTQALLIILLVWGLALLIVPLTGRGFRYDKAVRFVGYGITPILFVGIVSIIPVPYLGTICDLLAMPWAFVVLGAGMLPYLKLKPEHAPVLTGLICGLLFCLWGVLPILIPYLIDFIFW